MRKRRFQAFKRPWALSENDGDSLQYLRGRNGLKQICVTAYIHKQLHIINSKYQERIPQSHQNFKSKTKPPGFEIIIYHILSEDGNMCFVTRSFLPVHGDREK